MAHNHNHNNDEEDDYWTEAAAWRRANDELCSSGTRAEAWEILAYWKRVEGEYNDAISYGEMAEKMYGESVMLSSQGDAAYWQGRDNYRLSQYERAIECFERASDLFRESGSEIWLGDAIRGMAECNKCLENTDEAIIQFESAVRFYETNESWAFAGDCRLEAGELRGSCGHSAEALESFTSAREFYEKAESSLQAGRATDRMASSLIELNRLGEAINLLRTNIELSTFLEQPEAIAWAKFRLGATLLLGDEPREAIYWLDLARDFYKSNDRHAVKADIDLQRMQALEQLEMRADARQIGRELRAYWQSVANYDRIALFDINEALSQSSEGNLEVAIRIATQTAAMAKTNCRDYTQRITRLTLAEILVRAGQAQAAMDAFEGDQYGQWGDSVVNRSRHLLVLAAIAQLESRPHESRGLVERVIEISEENNLGEVLGVAFEMLADLAEKDGSHEREKELRAQAVAHFLAHGDTAAATHNARKLIPLEPDRKRDNEWHIIGAPSHEPDVPRTSERPSGSTPAIRERTDPSAPRPDSMPRRSLPKDMPSSPGAEITSAPQKQESSKSESLDSTQETPPDDGSSSPETPDSSPGAPPAA